MATRPKTNDLDQDPRPSKTPSPEIREMYRVVVQCDSEGEQRETYESLKSLGYVCRLLTL